MAVNYKQRIILYKIFSSHVIMLLYLSYLYDKSQRFKCSDLRQLLAVCHMTKTLTPIGSPANITCTLTRDVVHTTLKGMLHSPSVFGLTGDIC